MSSATATIPAGRVGAREAIRHALVLMRRSLLHIKTDPEQLVGMTIQPLMFLVLFVYVFGGAIAGSSREYLQFALPGILVQGLAFTGFSTALGLNKDFQAGLIDRFRSLPISRAAVVSGRIAGDSVRVIWSVVLIVGFGMLLGFRFSGGVAGAIAGMVLVSAFGVAMCWPMAVIGLAAKSPEAVNTGGFMIILPLTFASTVFAPAETMPGWLAAFVKVNPITKVVDAVRGLSLGQEAVTTDVGTLVWQAIAWIVVITAVFAPLAVRLYRRRM